MAAFVIDTPQWDELEPLAELLEAALHFPPSPNHDWLDRVPREDYRVVRQDGQLLAGLGIIQMGQWFGGQAIPCGGITVVGVSPAARGTGVGTAMLQQTLRDLHAAHIPLAALYPASLRFYRRVGFERAAQRISYELPIATIDVTDSPLEVVPLTDQDLPLARKIYQQQVRQAAGPLERPEWMWKLRLQPEMVPSFRFLLKRGAATEGYLSYTQGARGEPLRVLDYAMLTSEAGRRILNVIAGYRSMLEYVTWNGGPHDPLLYLLRESHIGGQRLKQRIERAHDLMIRLVDLPLALTARGYPVGLQAEFQLEVSDPTIAANQGRWRLQIADGRAEIAPGGDGRIQLGIREFAALYSGYLAPTELQLLGDLRGPADDLALLGAVFAGPQPYCPDMF